VCATWELEQLSFDALIGKTFRQLCTLRRFPASVDTFNHDQSTTSNMSRHDFVTKTAHTLYTELHYAAIIQLRFRIRFLLQKSLQH